MVPLFAYEMRDWSTEHLRAAGDDCVQMIASHGDDLQYGGEHQPDSWNALARGVAIMARAEGGVTCPGIHACFVAHLACPNPRRHIVAESGESV